MTEPIIPENAMIIGNRGIEIYLERALALLTTFDRIHLYSHRWNLPKANKICKDLAYCTEEIIKREAEVFDKKLEDNQIVKINAVKITLDKLPELKAEKAILIKQTLDKFPELKKDGRKKKE